MAEGTRTQAPTARTLWRDDPEYERARVDAVWNARKPNRFPDVIVMASSAEDVVEAVELAKSRAMRIAVRSGGHSWCGSAVRDGGMLIDLSELRHLSVDPGARTAVVEPAVSARDLAEALA